MSPVEPAAGSAAKGGNGQNPQGKQGVPAGSQTFQVTPQDRGIVERPILMPHFSFEVLSGHAAVVFSEATANALYGQRYVDLLPLLDGTRDRYEIAAALEGRHTPLEVQTALVSMASKGYVCSADYAMDSGRAAFWSVMGVSPRFAERRLAGAGVAVAGDDGSLTAALEDCGVVTVDGSAASVPLTVIATADYLDHAHARTNRRHIDSGSPWLLVAVNGVWPIFGPVFRPSDNGPCWHCLTHRMSGNREVDRFVRTRTGNHSITSRVAFPPVGKAVRRLAAVEVARWIVLGAAAPLHEHAVSASVFGITNLHRTMCRPQCLSCGDERLYRRDRASEPVVLRPSPKPVRNSGGVRAVPPQETLRRLGHLVDPVSGVVTQLVRVTSEDDPWLHVYWAGSNLALNSANLHILRNSLRSKSSGKGASPEQAEASALCEALERYSGVFQGDEIRRRERFSAFADGSAIHPNDVHRFSDRQLDQAEEINARGTRFNVIPARLNPEARIDWSPVWSLTEKRHRYLPTSMLYYAMPLPEGQKLYATPDSNGCAAGNTLEEAILQGFLELAERDAFACWWYNRVRLPRMDIDSFDSEYLSAARDYYRSLGREFWLLDATNDFGIPVFIGVSHRTDKETEDILYSAGAHLDPRIAALRTVCELNQYLQGIKDVKPDGSGYDYDDPEALHWWRTARLEDFPYLAPDPAAALRRADDYRAPDTEDARDDVEFCRKRVEDNGMEFMVLDQTRPDVGLPVAKVIVPGMRHFWARFGPGRLYDVPVRMGWLDRPLSETELNPVSVFI